MSDRAAVDWRDHLAVADKIAHSFQIYGHDPDDLRQEARLALWLATRTYDPARGAFPAYAGVCIRGRLLTMMKNVYRRPTTQILFDVYEAPEPAPSLDWLIDALPRLTDLERSSLRDILDGRPQKSKVADNACWRARRKLRLAYAA
jgi:DNA-directed RNA polymerase specialized sigma24 family protein